METTVNTGLLGQGTIVIKLLSRSWSGAKKLKPEDLLTHYGIDPDKLPSHVVATLGHKKIFDPEKLREWKRTIDNLERTLCQRGLYFNGYIVIAETDLKWAMDEIHKTIAACDALKRKLDENYEVWFDEWLLQPEIKPHEALIRAAREPKEKVLERLHFDFDIKREVPIVCEPDSPLAAANERQVKSMAQRLLEDIAQKMHESILAKHADEFYARVETTHKTLSPIKDVREKLEALSFIHPFATSIIKLIDEVNVQVEEGIRKQNRERPKGAPKSDKIRGAPLMAVKELVRTLSDPALIVKHGQAIFEAEKKAEEEGLQTARAIVGDFMACPCEPETADAEPGAAVGETEAALPDAAVAVGPVAVPQEQVSVPASEPEPAPAMADAWI